jgi:uncharacterized protein
MTLWQDILVLLAGVGAGAINTVVGSGTLITFPVLLTVGVPPVTANVSNTVGLFPGSFVGAYGYRRELAGQHRRVVRLGVASALGAAGGAVLLLVLPAAAFNAIVPVLIALALVLVVFGKQLSAWLTRRRGHPVTVVTAPLWLATLFTGVYGGYFGAAQGVLLMALLGLMLSESIQRQNALKNVLAGIVNLVAAVVFICSAHVDWHAVALVAAGSMVGGVIGARIGRRLSPPALRAIIVAVGAVALVKLLG